MMRWYITGSIKPARKVRGDLEGLEDEVSAHWMDRNPKRKFEDTDSVDSAMTVLDDIAKSHGIVYCNLAGDTDVDSETALGIALALNKRVVLIGMQTTQYHRLPMIEHYGSIKEFIETREDEKNVDV